MLLTGCLQHQFKHCICRTVRDRGTGVKHRQYKCPLPRCSAPIHTSEQSIREHIDVSHMSAFHALICPLRQCEGVRFTRILHLTNHLRSAHAALEGQRVNLHSELFLPSSRIFRPSSVPDPLPLPLPSIGATLVPAVANGPPRKSLWGAGTAPTPSLPRSPKRLKHTVSESSIEDGKESSSIVLDDLPIYDDTKSSTDFVVWRRPSQLQKDVVRPLPMLDPTVPRPTEPPSSILYNSFKARVDALEVEAQARAGLSFKQDQ
ncbi:uncharacterized protein BT62DRAFT_323399 [Guyanagaster necrorhizus]|uniref:C2H2-type domain-containing protein n=1 Tax=Guyanagaster necrorhizus TaxID=856835 RepID=A0A9P7VN97_9AGAR|nr:uncharacterized protein BT62DRAFT_323399 [Guyanagaster necrorhizus MCA 3950]KAG7443663.1 hypothetical protein BT62DRAFT_323399 [Guyanagaster necrorhizus MCA 3950]